MDQEPAGCDEPWVAPRRACLLRIRRGLPVSGKLTVLTDALAPRYWLPDGLDENSFEDWAQAFGVKGSTTSLTMRP